MKILRGGASVDMQPSSGMPARARAGSSAWLLLAGAFAAFTVSAGLMHSYAVFLVAFIQAFRLEPGRDLDRLFGLAARRRRELAVGRRDGRSARAIAAVAGRQRSFDRRADRLRSNYVAVADHPALRRRHDVRRQLPRACGVCADPVAALCAAARDGDIGRAVGQRLCPRRVGAGCAAVDLVLRLARDVFDPGRFYGGDGRAVGGNVSPRRARPAAPPEPGPGDRPPQATSRSARLSPSWTLAEAVRTPHFWLLFAVYLFTGLGSFLVSLHQLAFAVDRGFDKLYAAWVLGMGSLLAIAGTIVTGSLSDYIGRERAAILAYGMSILGVVCALFITRRASGLAVVAVRLLFRADLGGARPGDHRQDRRSVPRPPARHDSRRDHDRHRGSARRWGRGPPAGSSTCPAVTSWPLSYRSSRMSAAASPSGHCAARRRGEAAKGLFGQAVPLGRAVPKPNGIQGV